MATGTVFGGAIYAFARFLYSQQASSEVRSSDLVGTIGRVVIAIPADGVGQVRVRLGEELMDKIARTRDGGAIARERVDHDRRGPRRNSHRQEAVRERAMPDNTTTLYVILAVPAIVLAFFAAMYVFSRNYIKVSPNAVAVLSGRKRKLPDGRIVGYRMVRGGAALRIPLLEKVEYLHLNVMTIPLEIKRAYTLKGVPVSVKAVANVKIRGDDSSLQAAAERFLGMTHDEVQKVIFQTLEGHLRSILGTLTVEEVNSDRQSFAQKLTTEAATDLEKMGIGVDVLTIQEISDEEGYLDALGKRRTAEVKRDATIGEAEAHRDAKIKSSQALQEGEKAKFQADAEIALSSRDFMIRQAQYQAEIETQKARAEQAGPLSEATARQGVVAEEVRVEKTRTQEMISVQEQEVLRRQKELEATVIKPAEADRQAAVIRAEAAKQSAILEAEGRRSRDDRDGGSRAGKAAERRRRSRRRGRSRRAAPKPQRSRPSVSHRPRRSRPRASRKRPRSCARPRRGRSSTTPPACRRSSRSCRRSSKRRPASSARSRRRSATSTSWS